MMRVILLGLIVAGFTLALVPSASAAPQCVGTGGPSNFTGYCNNDPNCPTLSGNGKGVYVNGWRAACIENVKPAPNPVCNGAPRPGYTGACINDPGCRGPDGTPGIGTYVRGVRESCTYF